MSGHSKWATTKRQKGAADAKRGALFTKLAKKITVAARDGGGDPDSNFSLRLAVDLAKAGNMPKDNIERAIKRGTGELEGGQIEEITYEGFGPDGVAFIIEALTDNRNRTSANIKHYLSKYGGSLGGPNAVSWMFERLGVIRIEQRLNEEEELAMIEAGAQDIKPDDEGTTIYIAPEGLQDAQKKLEGFQVAVTYGQIEWVPKEEKQVEDSAKQSLEKLEAELDEDDDVNEYFNNASI